MAKVSSLERFGICEYRVEMKELFYFREPQFFSIITKREVVVEYVEKISLYSFVRSEPGKSGLEKVVLPFELEFFSISK